MREFFSPRVFLELTESLGLLSIVAAIDTRRAPWPPDLAIHGGQGGRYRLPIKATATQTAVTVSENLAA